MPSSALAKILIFAFLFTMVSLTVSQIILYSPDPTCSSSSDSKFCHNKCFCEKGMIAKCNTIVEKCYCYDKRSIINFLKLYYQLIINFK
uniref:Uncharacterized protein n=1 Tax=Panagrolaimus sp. PS1159 TaxID=55785 RepID=A0AC35F7N8_9BILA